ncbi:MAG: invasion associated locus B family protein [Amaricoccus sp.]
MQSIRTRQALTALALMLALPAAAQQAPAPAAEAPAAPAAEAPAVGAAPDATAAPAKPEVMEIVKDTFGDWQVRCAPDGNQCMMYQLALDNAKNPVAEVSILKLPDTAEADAGVTVVTPLGTLLTAGVAIQVDTGDTQRYPFAWCSQVGCFARFGLTKPAIDAMKRGKSGKISLVSVGRPEAPVVLALSLSGFTAAFESLQPLAEPAGAPGAPAAATPAPLAPKADDPAPLAPRN